MTALTYDRIAASPLPGQIAHECADAMDSAGSPGMAHDAYISYSHVDKAAADAACATLERAGIRCWIAPRDITPGDEWSAAIIKAIDQCRVMVLIFSASANNSRQIRREVERAINVGLPVVPVRIEDVAPTESLAYFIGTVHWLDALTPPLENHLQKLAESIKALLQVRAPSATNPAMANPAGLIDQRQTATVGPAAAASTAHVTAGDKAAKHGMFHDLMNFSYQRTPLQAVGWYLLYFLIGIIIGMVSGYIAGIASTTFAEGFNIGTKAGQISAIPYHILLGTLLIWHRPKDVANILLVLAGVVLSVFLGALGGLIPLAVLTSRPVIRP